MFTDEELDQIQGVTTEIVQMKRKLDDLSGDLQEILKNNPQEATITDGKGDSIIRRINNCSDILNGVGDSLNFNYLSS